MRNVITILGCLLLVASPSMVRAQGAPGVQGAPTRTATASTSQQEAAVRTGIGLHDQGKFDEAIAVYEGILKESPGNMMALYELAYSLGEKKDYAKSIAAARRGTEYRSEQLPQFYDLLGSAYDQMGDPRKAVEAYRQGVRVVPGAGILYYNMGVTYLESLKEPDQARRALEQALRLEPTQTPIHLLLGQVYQSNGYLVPGFFAFATYLVYEPAGADALRAYGFLRSMLRAGVQAGPSGMQGGPARPPAPQAGQTTAKTDEGDFTAVETQMAANQRTFLGQLDAGMPEIQALVTQIDRLLASLAVRDVASDRAAFAGRHYLPYFAELKKRGFAEPFIYWAIQRAPVDGVQPWLTANEARVKAFLEWTKSYKWPES